MKYQESSDLCDLSGNGFKNTGAMLNYRHEGRDYFRRLYKVADASWKGDLGDDFKVPTGYFLMATGSRFGHFCYILVKLVGKVAKYTNWNPGFRYRFKFVSEMLEDGMGTTDVGYIHIMYWGEGHRS